MKTILLRISLMLTLLFSVNESVKAQAFYQKINNATTLICGFGNPCYNDNYMGNCSGWNGSDAGWCAVNAESLGSWTIDSIPTNAEVFCSSDWINNWSCVCANPLASNFGFTGDSPYYAIRDIQGGQTDPNSVTCDVQGGCTTPGMDNYLSTATYDNGECYRIGCMSSWADNTDPLATINDESCYRMGCTDQNADNYDNLATTNNGSCYKEGCTDNWADNYDSQATQNTLEENNCWKNGCMSDWADNYDSQATHDENVTCYKDGCTTSWAWNFDSEATQNPPTSDNYDPCEFTFPSFDLFTAESGGHNTQINNLCETVELEWDESTLSSFFGDYDNQAFKFWVFEEINGNLSSRQWISNSNSITIELDEYSQTSALYESWYGNATEIQSNDILRYYIVPVIGNNIVNSVDSINSFVPLGVWSQETKYISSTPEVHSLEVAYDPYLGVVVSWDDLSTEPSAGFFEIYKDYEYFQPIGTIQNDGSIDINASGRQQWIDETAVSDCESYDYQVMTRKCEFSTISSAVSVLISADLLQTFNPQKKLEASKGYYPNQVRLIWDNNNNDLVDKFKIWRKVYSSNNDSWILLDQVNNSQHTYIDLFADANVLYQYKIEAEVPCGDLIKSLNSNIEVGFRLPEATVSGHVEYEGGNTVQDIKVRVESSNEIIDKSIVLDGTNYLDLSSLVSHSDNHISSNFTLSAWYKSSLSSNVESAMFSFNNLSFYILNNNTFRVNYFTTDSISQSLDVIIEDINFTEWHNFTFTLNNTGLFEIFINGESKFSQLVSNSIQNQFLYIGKDSASTYCYGYIEEIKIWNDVLSQERINFFDKYISSSDTNLIGLFHCDEGYGNSLFDVSKNSDGIHNKNDIIFNNASYSNLTPGVDKLSNYSYTDENGNYIVNGVRYAGVGNSFVVTPLAVAPYYSTDHEFEPSQRVVFLGDASIASDGQDFTDISSFIVSGFVYYHDLHDSNQNMNTEEVSDFPVDDVMIKIDGEPVIQNGFLVTTNTYGYFEVEVPIGNHRISVDKLGHTFSNSNFPATGVYDFQEDKSGLSFTDNTVIHIKGRAVGGIIEGDKALGMGLSNNNIGIASFRFSSQKLSGLDELEIQTETSAGEYSAELLPEKYQIFDFGVYSNPSIAQFIDFQAFDVLDLTAIPELTKVYDTIFASDNTVSSVDSAYYHFDQSFIYKATPSIRVLNIDKTGLFMGEESLELKDDIITNLESFEHPIFMQSELYESYILVEEEYINYDQDINNVDRVPVKNGQLSITNHLSTDLTAKNILLDSEDGDTLYSFRVGFPNLSTNDSYPLNSFTETWEITFETGQYTGMNSVSWMPNDEIYRGIIFGAKPDGSNFITEGPQVVSHILRDPPGSASFAFYEEGSTLSQSMEVSTSLGKSSGMETEVSLGPSFFVGLGFMTEVEINASASASEARSAAIGHDGEYVDFTTFTSSFSTSDDDFYQGSMMDIYMGRSMNMNFGMSTVLTLIDDVTCSLNIPAIECVGESINGYKIGRQKGFFAVPGGYGTEFYYTQYEIIFGLIPELTLLKSNQLLNDPRYSNVVSGENYGSNNDDPIWGENVVSDDSLNVISNLGPSYTFSSSADTAQVDSVRWYNQQIRLWQEAIAKNEELKLGAVPVDYGASNISFDGGVGDVTYSYENGKSDSNAITWETSVAQGLSTEVGASIAGVGLSVEASMEITLDRSGSHTFSEENTTTVGFTLSDGTLNDKYSIDIKDDGTSTNGKVFSVQGGRTACPYQDQELTLFYETGTELSAATVQMEQPTISISPSSLSNVPEDEPAVFNLSLGNSNPLGYDIVYTLKVLEMTNPNGAIIKIDGLTANREFMVPAGSSINKVLTVEKGPVALDYSDIKLVFHSSCQYDPTDLANSIYQESTFSVSFLPGCTDIDIIDPDPNWVVNSEDEQDGETYLNVILSDYNYNYYSLDNMNLQYKTSNSSDWVNIATYHKEPEIDELGIPLSQSFIDLSWDVTDLPDGDYDLRANTDCNLASEGTEIYSGHIDRVRPHSFGSPSPSDGILDPNDEIQINFNENINEAILGYPNFSISGLLNGSNIRHDASLYFDGNDAMSIPEGLSLQNKSFTMEMWVNPHSSGVLFSQGYNEGDQMSIKLNEQQHLELSLSSEAISSTSTIDYYTWTHIAIIYDKEIGQASFLINGDVQSSTDAGIEILADYKGEGPISVGDNFTGNMHELRVWKGIKGADIAAQMLKTQSGNEPNLMGLWSMDELEGNPLDKARSRHASSSASWQVNPGGVAYSFDASNNEYITAQTSDLSFRDDQDFTIEIWFKSDGPNQTILSNGIVMPNPSNPDELYGNYQGWTISTNSEGKIEVINNLNSIESNQTFSDNNWHHLALVKKNMSNTSLYIDGIEQGYLSSNLFKGFSGSELVVGAKAEGNLSEPIYTSFLNGSVDEIRIWSKARKLAQINRDSRSKLAGNEKALVAYYPFETYQLDEYNQMVTSFTKDDQHLDTDIYVSHNFIGTGGSYNDNDKPLVRLERPIESVGFTYSSNGDRVILSISDELNKVEGCILDIEVDGVKDLYNNTTSSPITWTAFINQNQLIWDQQDIHKEKLIGEPLAFSTTIVNQGGTIESYEITNLPEWLIATPSEGNLAPNSYQQITFVVNDNLFIGEYTEDVILTGNNNYGERLEINVEVEAQAPDYSLNPNDFLYTMNILGKVTVDNIRSRDESDVLLAYVNDELRGHSNLIYVPEFDSYIVFLSIYSNTSSIEESENIEFRLWDASKGSTLANVSVNSESVLEFQSDAIIGSFENLAEFNATNTYRQIIPLYNGWNWLSFNLNPVDEDEDSSTLLIPTVFSEVNQGAISSFKNQDAYSQNFTFPDGSVSWFGTLNSLPITDMFMLKIDLETSNDIVDTIVYDGLAVLPSDHPININSGWNWIGYLGQKTLDLNTALSSLNPSSGDIVKSKTAFSMYASDAIGWIGSLYNMQVGDGYMIRSSSDQVLIYPESSLYGSSTFRLDKNHYSNGKWPVNSNKHEYSMNIIAEIDFDNQNIDNILGAFNKSECMGNISVSVISQDKSLYFLTVYGDYDYLMRFEYLDSESEVVYSSNNRLPFERNAIIGSIENPYIISLSNSDVTNENRFSLLVYPNPFNSSFEVEFFLEAYCNVELNIYDVMGRKVDETLNYSLSAGANIIQMDLENIKTGVYFIELKVGDKINKQLIIKSK